MRFDFADARYLGLRHSSRELEAWSDLATGFPAAFLETPDSAQAGLSIARLQGLEDGVVAPSTLHLFWDWFGGLSPNRNIVYADAHLYRVGNWGVERAAGRGVQVVQFEHHSHDALRILLDARRTSNRRPIVVTDGWCPCCGRAAPLHEYVHLLEPLDGWLVVDDTQALGVIGEGGLLPSLQIGDERVVSISSLAKAFGVPLAALCGTAAAVKAFRDRSETRVFASPASASAIRAAKNALRVNALNGDFLRRKLFQNVGLFRNRLAGHEIKTGGGPFPVQFINNISGKTARQLHSQLWRQGIRSVLSTGHDGKPLLCFLLNARHTAGQIEQACEAISTAIWNRHSLIESTSNFF